MSAPVEPAPARGWPRLHPAEAMRLRGLVVLALALVALAGARRLARPEALAPSPRCAAGVVAQPGRLACAPAPGAPVRGLAAWWLGAAPDVNSADPETLSVVPGIGPKLAQRIVEDRAARGPFARIEDVTRVKGIGPALAARLGEIFVAHSTDQRSMQPSGSSNR